jgi:hypothetical protein
VSGEFVAASILTILLALITGYTRGVDTRVSRVEADARRRDDEDRTVAKDGDAALWHESAQLQSQINMLRDKIHAEHPSRTETDVHRHFVERTLEELKNSHIRMEARIDGLQPAHLHRRESDKTG